jgi:hypothetical protein
MSRKPQTSTTASVLRHWFQQLLTAAAVCLGLTGCGEEACRQGAATATIEKYVPEGQRIECENSRTFDVEGRRVALEIVQYGRGNDCPAGCEFAFVCSIRDGESLSLLSAFWLAIVPIGVADECPGLQGEGGALRTNQTASEICEPSGLSHPLASTPGFINFMREQRDDAGPFRWCADYRLFQ